jgi:hypothetical protein
MWNQIFNGYCPECKLNGEDVPMRLNAHDFYESEKTGLQIAISFPGVQAAVLNFRGKGKFRKTVSYAHDVENGEYLSPQVVDGFPFCGNDVFQDEDEFADYLKEIKN